MSAADRALAQRDAGMALAAEAERRDQPAFAEAAYAAIVAVARRQSTVHIDDVLAEISVKPKHPNAAGAVWSRAIKEGVLRRTVDVRRCVTDSGKNGHRYPVYRSGLFRAPNKAAKIEKAAGSAAPSKQMEMFGGRPS